MVKILAALVAALVAALSILNSSGASPGATEKVAALVARATCSGASHSSDYMCSTADPMKLPESGWRKLCVFAVKPSLALKNMFHGSLLVLIIYNCMSIVRNTETSVGW